jgi:hypothetical protein
MAWPGAANTAGSKPLNFKATLCQLSFANGEPLTSHATSACGAKPRQPPNASQGTARRQPWCSTGSTSSGAKPAVAKRVPNASPAQRPTRSGPCQAPSARGAMAACIAASTNAAASGSLIACMPCVSRLGFSATQAAASHAGHAGRPGARRRTIAKVSPTIAPLANADTTRSAEKASSPVAAATIAPARIVFAGWKPS